MLYHIPVPDERTGMELDEFLALSFPLLNKGFLRRSVRDGSILVDGMPAHPSQRLRRDQVLIIEFDEEEDAPSPPVAPSASVPVLYEDEHCLCVDKPPGLAVEPERWARGEACLAGALLQLTLDRSGHDDRNAVTSDPLEPLDGGDQIAFRPRLVHRIDKDTSGVLLVAKDLETERLLREAFDQGEVGKVYFALVEGDLDLEPGETRIIDLPIAPDERRSGSMRVAEEGKPSRTRISIERAYRGYTLVRCEPLTGRTHQIRVHLAETGFPLAVDPQYGRRKELKLSEIKAGYRAKPGRVEGPLIERLTLHAAAIEFPAADGSRRRVESPLPRDFERVLKQLAKVRPPRRDSGRS